ncbi:MAG: hypothetical protein CVT47_01800 [Thermoplasmata archaeon HGW-Thermoplasmata-2]|nr:MAG: hypothetical protein CVT47_01800 [Thermoplasmata archaeon HGW-Thermoplasmata-2]
MNRNSVIFSAEYLIPVFYSGAWRGILCGFARRLGCRRALRDCIRRMQIAADTATGSENAAENSKTALPHPFNNLYIPLSRFMVAK